MPAWNKGLSMWSEEDKARMSAERKGRKHTPEARAKISASTKGMPSHTKGHKLTEEHKAKLSAAAKGKPPNNKGKPRSAKARAKASASMKGHDTSPETRARIGAKHKGKVVSEATRKKIGDLQRGMPGRRTGIPQSPETKVKMSKNSLAQWEKMSDEQKAKKAALLIDSSRDIKESWIEGVVAQRFDAQGIIYERQKRIGWYRVDFYIPAENRIVEVNGCFWHACEHCGEDLHKDKREADAKRYAYLRGKGYIVEVIWEHTLPRKRTKPG